MPIRYTATTARFDGVCAIEEAGELAEWLMARPQGKGAGRAARKVDLAPCTALHTALIQVLMALAPPIKNPPKAEALARWLGGCLAMQPGSAGAPVARQPREKVCV